MKQWEYKIVGIPRNNDASKILNELGKERWELVTAHYYGGYNLILKRELSEYRT